MSGRINKVIIVGGGTAGWMAAAVLSRAFGDLLEITLVESEQIGTVGVGEATIPQIRLLLAMLGIDEHDFLRRTQGTMKLGIRFHGWGCPGERYIHAFGDIGRPLGMLEFYHYWLRARRSAPPLWAFSLNAASAAANRYERFEQFGDTGLSGLVRAYHFDAGLVAGVLREYAGKRGVTRIEGIVSDTRLRAVDGFIEQVVLDDGRRIDGQLFFDCSGFRGLLIEQALHTGYEHWGHWLPCDRALAVPSASVDPLTPYTQSTAREAGWQWRIPLQQRTGNGHVYCSHYLSDDAAHETLMRNLDAEPLAEPRLLRFSTGRRKRFWNRNCVALGLASGFLEPLESTSIHLVQSALSRLMKCFPDSGFEQAAIDEYNRQCTYEIERVRDFIILHYHLNRHSDSPFWEDRQAMPVPDTLTAKMELFRTTGLIFEDAEDLFKTVAWLQVMTGQGLQPLTYHPLAERPTDAQLQRFFGDLCGVIEKRVASLQGHRDYLRQHCPAG